MTVYYHDSTANRGYYFYPRNGYTFSEPQDARWWFPCFDEPWDKATSEMYVTVPENYYVSSNGYLESIYHNPNDQTRTFHWVNDYPIATYLMNFIIMSGYAVWEDNYIAPGGDTIPILNMVYAEDSTMAAYDFGNVPAMMQIFSQQFYPYPFSKYGQGAVAPFPYGAMEHQTMTTMNRTGYGATGAWSSAWPTNWLICGGETLSPWRTGVICGSTRDSPPTARGFSPSSFTVTSGSWKNCCSGGRSI
jgi:aminopeptidase N